MAKHPATLLVLLMVLICSSAIWRGETRRPTVTPSALEQIAKDVDDLRHDCVPLGWYPSPIGSNAFVPAYNTDVASTDSIFTALWVSEVPKRDDGNEQLAEVRAVMDELTRERLLVRTDDPDGERYNLTSAGLEYYYDQNDVGENVERWPYVCFSRILASKVTWASRPARNEPIYGNYLTARVRVVWRREHDAYWVTPFLKNHAIALNPTANPVMATAVRLNNGKWVLAQIDFSAPLIERPSAWTKIASTEPNGIAH